MIRPHGFVLMYGDRQDLHRKLLNGLVMAGMDKLPFLFWMNTVCPESQALVRSHPAPWRSIESKENVPKYIAMGRMFAEAREYPGWDWIFWYDDDVSITRPDYLVQWTRSIDSGAMVCAGQRRDLRFRQWPGMLGFIKTAAWYRGRPFGKPPGGRGVGVPFARGWHWVLRRDLAEGLSWPDPRLTHNRGDVLLGAAVYQAGYKVHDYSYGIQLNEKRRRGMCQPPPLELYKDKDGVC